MFPRSSTASLSLMVLVCLLLPGLVAASPDLNGDGKVDAKDVAIFVSGWQRYKTGQGEWGEADVNNDGVIDTTDARLLLDALLIGYVPTVQLANYLPATEGDLRLWQGDDGLIATQQRLEASGLQNDLVEDKVVSMFNDTISRTIWRVANGHVAAFVGWFDGGTLLKTSASNDGIPLPDSLTLGQPAVLNFDVYSGGATVGSGSLTLTLEAPNQAVDTPAGTFGGCIRIRVRLQYTVNGSSEVDESVRWLASGVGAVQHQQIGDGQSERYVLAYAKVGGSTYGQRPDINVAQDMPMPEGSLFIWQNAEGLHGMRALTHSGQDPGSTRYVPVANLRLPLGADATLWAIDDNGFINGFVGWRTFPSDLYLLAPPFNWRDVMPLGYIEALDAAALHMPDATPTPCSLSCAIVGDNQTATTPAGTFTGCHVYCLRVEARQGAEWLMQLRYRMWVKPGFGPVRVEYYEGVDTTQAAQPPADELVFGRNGLDGQSYGTQPTCDLAQCMTLSAGNCRRLIDNNGDWRVQTIVGQSQVGGRQAWEELEAESAQNQLFGGLWSDFWATGSSSLWYMGTRLDPDDIGTYRILEARPPINIPMPLRMGDPVHFDAQLVDPSTGTAAMTVSGDILYGARSAVACPAGTFSPVHVVQFYTETQEAGSTERDREVTVSYYHDTAGLVAETLIENPGSQQQVSQWRAQWIKVGAHTWNYPGSFDIATYYPLATGNIWRHGRVGGDYLQGEVGAPTSVGDYDSALPLTRWESSAPAERDIYYHVLQPAARLLVAYKPPDYPHTAFYAQPVRWPRPWRMGEVARTVTNLTDPQTPILSVPTTDLAVPVQAGITVDTPAGRFTNCIRLAVFKTFDLSSIGEDFSYFHRDMVLAPDVGPVVIQEREGDDEEYWGPGPLLYARINGHEYGAP